MKSLFSNIWNYFSTQEQIFPLELQQNIIRFIADENTLKKIRLVCKSWKKFCESRHNQAWNYPYYKMWKENIELKSSEDTPYLIFKQRFQRLGLPALEQQLRKHNLINSLPFSENIEFIRQGKYPWDHPMQLVNLNPHIQIYCDIDMWASKAKQALQQESYHIARYYLKEFLFIAEASEEGRLKLKEARDNLSQFILDDQPLEAKEQNYFIFKNLFTPSSLIEYLRLCEHELFFLKAASDGFIEIIQAYISLKDPLFIKNCSIVCTLAALNRNFEIIQLLLNQPFLNCTTLDKEDLDTALHALCSIDECSMPLEEWEQWLSITNQFIMKGCSLTQKDKYQMTPIDIAAHTGNASMLEFLLPKLKEMDLKSYLEWVLSAITKKEELTTLEADQWINTFKILLNYGVEFEPDQLTHLMKYSSWVLDCLLSYSSTNASLNPNLIFSSTLQSIKDYIQEVILNTDNEETKQDLIAFHLNECIPNFNKIIQHKDFNKELMDSQSNTILHLIIINLAEIDSLLKNQMEEKNYGPLSITLSQTYLSIIQQIVTDQKLLLLEKNFSNLIRLIPMPTYSSIKNYLKSIKKRKRDSKVEDPKNSDLNYSLIAN